MSNLYRKKSFIGIVCIIMAVSVIGTIFWLIGNDNATDRTSESGRLTVEHVHDGMKIPATTKISGTYRGSKSTGVYYLVSSADHKVVGAGTISPLTNSHFEHDLQLNTIDYKDQKGELRVYAQSPDGQLLDNVTVAIILQ